MKSITSILIFIMAMFLYVTVNAQGTKTGVNTLTPDNALHIVPDTAGNDPVKIEGLNKGVGTESLIMVDTLTGILKRIKYMPGLQQIGYMLKGTTSLTINQGNAADVPGITVTHTVPDDVAAQTLVFTIVGYAPKNPTSGGGAQGVFELYQNGVKVTSAYTSVADSRNTSPNLVNLPVPATLLHSVTLPPGTYTFKVRYSAWAGNVTVNYIPAGYVGYNGDTEAMLTRMKVEVYNR